MYFKINKLFMLQFIIPVIIHFLRLIVTSAYSTCNITEPDAFVGISCTARTFLVNITGAVSISHRSLKWKPCTRSTLMEHRGETDRKRQAEKKKNIGRQVEVPSMYYILYDRTFLHTYHFVTVKSQNRSVICYRFCVQQVIYHFERYSSHTHTRMYMYYIYHNITMYYSPLTIK